MMKDYSIENVTALSAMLLQQRGMVPESEPVPLAPVVSDLVKTPLVVSVSGGRTSMYMAIMLKRHFSHMYEMIFVFANTGKEREETLVYLQQCDEYFDLGIVWIEGVFSQEPGIGIRHQVIDYKTANRTGKPFEDMISKYGLPGMGVPYCFGFRFDEQHRVKDHIQRWVRVEEVFPLNELRINKAQVEEFWNNKPYRLSMPRILGNCDACFMKGKNALIAIFQHFPELADPWIRDEEYVNSLGLYDKPASYIEGVTYRQLRDAAQSQIRLFDLEDAAPAFTCACTT